MTYEIDLEYNPTFAKERAAYHPRERHFIKKSLFYLTGIQAPHYLDSNEGFICYVTYVCHVIKTAKDYWLWQAFMG